MEFKISKSDLQESLNSAAKACSSKSTLPQLEGIYLSAKNNKLTLRATDGDLFIEKIVPTAILEEGDTVINSKIISEIVRKLPNSDVSFRLENGSILIDCKKSHFEILELPKENFPKLPEVIPSTEITVPQKLIKDMVKGTAFATSNDNARPILQGILFEVKDSKLTLVALDGYRLALKTTELNIDSCNSFSVVLSSRIFSDISKLLNEKDNVSVKLTQNQILFETDDTKIVSRLLEGNFINYTALLPNESSILLTVNKHNFEDAIERAALVGKVDDKILVKLETSDDKIFISSNSNIGKSKEEVDAEITGGNIQIAFNSNYMLDVLKNIDDEKITLNLNNSVSPCLLKNDTSKYLVLPVRIA